MTQARQEAGEAFTNPPGRWAALPVSFPAITTNVLLATNACVLTWWSLTETTGAAPASVTIFDGADATGQELATVNLIANETNREATGFRGLYCTRGVFVRVNSGTVKGTVATVDA